MANLDFISIPFANYIENHLYFKRDLMKIPKIFATNYFLKDEQGNFITPKTYKLLWVLWANGRAKQEYEAIETPVGLIPRYEDLSKIAKSNLKRDYNLEEYITQFSIRIHKYLEKMDRMKIVFSKTSIPSPLNKELEQQIKRLNKTQEKFDQLIVSPLSF
jgi:phosphoenolpyruvate carboxykinase (GTP)